MAAEEFPAGGGELPHQGAVGGEIHRALQTLNPRDGTPNPPL